jgi:hypothetical protein
MCRILSAGRHEHGSMPFRTTLTVSMSQDVFVALMKFNGTAHSSGGLEVRRCRGRMGLLLLARCRRRSKGSASSRAHGSCLEEIKQ